MVDDERLFVTDDSSIHKQQKLDPADMEILEGVKTGEGMITVNVEELKKLAEAAANTFKECQEMVEPMTKEQAEVVRKLRVEEGYSWRAIAHACYDLGWGHWSPPSNQIVGMAICERAAQFFGEDYKKEPWN